ncbi:hypothetical protein ACLOJK_021139 [Asimina triloba]
MTFFIPSEKMPGRASDPGDSLVPFSPAFRDPLVYRLHHSLRPPIAHLSISWSRENYLTVAFFRKSTAEPGNEVGGKVVEVKLDAGDAEIDDAQKRRIAYELAPAFALLQSRSNALLAASRMAFGSPSLRVEWWQHVMEYSKHISSFLGAQRRTDSVIEDLKMVIKVILQHHGYKGDSATSVGMLLDQLEALIELLGSEAKTAGGLEFLHKCVPGPAELSFARLRPGFCEADLPSQALSSVRLALATNLGWAFLEVDVNYGHMTSPILGQDIHRITDNMAPPLWKGGEEKIS